MGRPPITQSVSPGWQPVPQAPPEHAWPAGQTLPHVPQLLLSLLVFAQ
jgi:hypothetical protein